MSQNTRRPRIRTYESGGFICLPPHKQIRKMFARNSPFDTPHSVQIEGWCMPIFEKNYEHSVGAFRPYMGVWQVCELGPWGDYFYPRIGKGGCSGHLVFYIKFLAVYTYGLFLGMVSCIGDPVKPPFMINHEWPSTEKPALYLPLLYNYPLMTHPVNIWKGTEPFRQLNYLGHPPYRKRIIQKLGAL